MQNIEGRQPHTTKVATISTDEPPAGRLSIGADGVPAAIDAAGSIDAGRSAMRDALRHVASALKAAEIPFALAGSYALWVFGGPEGAHDVDFVVPEACVDDAARALQEAGFRVERPPEDWLFKAWHGGVMVDVLHRLVGTPVEARLVDGAESHDVLGVRIPVLDPTVVLTTKVLSLNERYCDLGALLPGARAVRERVDWARLREASAGHAYAETFVYLVDRLGIADKDGGQ